MLIIAFDICRKISIHAPHEGERRQHRRRRATSLSHFNPRSPRGGATRSAGRKALEKIIFQSTLPTRGSDIIISMPSFFLKDFNPRSPRGGATFSPCLFRDMLSISIHAPHEGERRVACNAGGYFVDISIHAPHEGERPVIHKLLLFKRRISIHAPHEGERH